MSEETWRFVKLFLRMSVVGTALGLPVALLLRQYIPATYPHKTAVMTVGLTAFGLALKKVYFDRAAREDSGELREVPALPNGLSCNGTRWEEYRGQ